MLERVLEKYSIRYLLVDNSIIIPGSNDQTSLYLPQLKKLIAADPNIKLVKTFGTLELYEHQLQGQPNTFIDTKTVDIPPPSIVNPSRTFYPTFDQPLQNHSQLTQASNCDNFNGDLYTRQVSADQILYQAVNASSCDHFVYKNVPHDRTYQLKIRHRNISGEPFFVCLEDHVTKQCELFTYLPQSSDWSTATLDIPRLNPVDSGFTLHLYTYSIGRVLTQNAWSDISLTEAKAVPEPQINTGAGLALVKRVDHPNTTYYQITVEPEEENTRLVLNQAFDGGWKAYALQSSTANPLAPLLLSPLPPTRHELVKDWANGWILAPRTQIVVLYFAPQTWQYIGFGLLALLPILVVAHKRERN